MEFRNNEDIRQNDEDLRDAQIKTKTLKNDIQKMKRALRTAYDIDSIVKYENELKKYQKDADQLGT